MPSTDPNRGEAAGGELTGFDGLYGLEITGTGDGRLEGRVVVGDEHKQPAGIVHGGVYAAMAEALASIGTWIGVGAEGKKSVAGMSNNTSFLRPLSQGTANATATARHRGRTTWVWDVEVSDDQQRTVAISRVTIAVRDL